MAAITFNVSAEAVRAAAPEPRKGRYPEVAESSEPLFVRPKPDIRNPEGLWVARELNGRAGGLFFLKSSAISFARKRAGQAGCATIFPAETFELDISNEGNPLIDYMRQLRRAVATLRRPR